MTAARALANLPSGHVENKPRSVRGRAAGKRAVPNTRVHTHTHTLITETQPFLPPPPPPSLLCLISELVEGAGTRSQGWVFSRLKVSGKTKANRVLAMKG